MLQALDRIGDGSDIAAALLWPASDQGRFVTGATIAVDGDFTPGIAAV